MTVTLHELREAQGADVIDPQGDKIGTLRDIYYDDASGEPEWISVQSGMINRSTHLVPIEGAARREDGLVVAYTKDRVEETPEIDADEISPETERQLYSSYGIAEARPSARTAEEKPATGGTQPPEAGRPIQPTGSPDEAEPGVTLHEQDITVGKRRVPAGQVRIRKWVEAETVERDVDLERQRAEVHREPINQPAPGAQLGEETAEMELEREEPVVERQTRATERVSLERASEEERQRISAEAARERAEVETDEDRPGRRRGR